ncbi:MAG: SDR family NAD(P)-dependent oxidoreductase [Halobacteriaceae archaeon]
MADADLSGETILLTGGTSGIGRAAAGRLADRGATVLVTGRDEERGRAVERELAARGGRGGFLRADFERLDAVRDLAARVRERTDGLDALVHNAGCARAERRITGDGNEYVFQVNHLAPYLLTHDLFDRVWSAAPSRVVVTSSRMHRRGTLDFEDLTMPAYDALEAYARSKLANVLFAHELARRAPAGVDAAAVHPGFVPGSGLYRSVGLPVRVAVGVARYAPRVGTSVTAGGRLLAAHAAGDVETGEGVYYDGRVPTDPAPAAREDTAARRLWQVSADLVCVGPDWA